MNKQNITATVMACSLFLLSACGGSSSDSDNTAGGNGSLTVAVTDAPVDGATEVVVVFDAIELKPKEGSSFTVTFDEAKSIDLLALQNGESEPLLDSESIDAGEYNWMRLMVTATEGVMDSYISFEDGLTYSLYIPSGDTTGLKLNRSFTVPAGGSASFIIDFDLRKSVINPGNNSDDYKLKPTLRIEDNSEVGGISGFIAASLVSDESCMEGLAVYVYSGTGIAADDEGSQTPPLASVIPEYNGDTDQYDYQLSFMAAGDYTVAITCDADNDDPETDENETDWSAIASADASVVVDETTETNFE